MTKRITFRILIIVALALVAVTPGGLAGNAAAGVSAPSGASIPAATHTYSNTSSIPIPDGITDQCVGNPGSPAISTITVGDSGAIQDLNVVLNITHTWVGDVAVHLTSPSGTTMVLVDRPGGDSGCRYSTDNIITMLDDESGGGSVELASPPTGPSYTPHEPLSTFDGEDSAGDWTLQVWDYVLWDTGTLNSWSLIIDVSDAPVAVDDTYTTTQATPLTITAPGVLANDSDPNGDPLTAALASGPAHGMLMFSPDGSFTYTPDPHWSGTDSFTYHAKDAIATSNIATVTISVTAVIPPTPTPPITVPPTANPPTDIPLASGPTAADHARAQASLCADLNGATSAIIRADVPSGAVPGGSVFCRVVAENGAFRNPVETARVGVMSVLERGVIHAVDVFGLTHGGQSATIFSAPFRVCLQGQGVMIYLDATTAPRAVSAPPTVFEGGYTCTTIPHAGMVVLVPAQ